MNHPLDDADLVLIEINTDSPLVHKLVEEIRFLRDCLCAHEFRIAELQDQAEEAEDLRQVIYGLEDELYELRRVMQ